MPRPPLPTPDTKVVELRVHGIMGTTAAGLVDASCAVDVAGDGVGRVVRPADRLLRPAPGPMLRACGRSTPRTVEGYQWSGMTSGGWSKSIWALLFPFSLVNLAHWMLPPIPEGVTAARVLGGCARALVRLAALLLTALLVCQLEVVSLDLFAVHCLQPGNPCAGAIPGWVRGNGALRTVMGLLPVALLVFLLHRVSTVRWKPLVSLAHRERTPPHQVPELPGDNIAADPDTPALRTLHLGGSLAIAALLALGDPTAPAAIPVVACRVAALALGGVSVLGVLLLDDPSGGRAGRGGRLLRGMLAALPRSVLLALAGALLVATAVLRSAHPQSATASGIAVQSLGAAIAGCCVLLGLLLVPAALLARREWARLPRELRPWAGGWMAAPALALAGLLGGGFGAGIGIAVRELLGGDMPMPAGYHYITLLWGLTACAVVVLGACAAAVVKLHAVLRGRREPEEIGVLHPLGGCDARNAGHAAWTAAAERGHMHHAVIALAVALSAGAATAVGLLTTGVHLPAWAGMFSGIGVAGLGLLALALLRAVFLAARRPSSARHLGSLTDLASFWPREAHPIVPPCYALKAVPELAARAEEHLRDPHTRVVLSGHSHGSLLAVVAAARLSRQLPPEHFARLGLVTAGAPLQWAYLRAFPAVVPFGSLAALTTRLAGRWRSLCRLTDPFGGAVGTWERQVYHGELLGVGFRPGEEPGPLPAATEGPNGALVLGGDHWLPDPAHGPITGRRWVAGVRGHVDYSADPEWDRATAMAAGLDPAAPTTASASHPLSRAGVPQPGSSPLFPGYATGT